VGGQFGGLGEEVWQTPAFLEASLTASRRGFARYSLNVHRLGMATRQTNLTIGSLAMSSRSSRPRNVD